MAPGYLDAQPEPEEEFKAEIEAYEKEQAAAEAAPPDDKAPPAEDDAAKAAAEAAAKAAAPPPATGDDPDPEDERAPVPFKALKAERARRQELEKNVAAMSDFLANLSRQPQTPPAPQGEPPANEDPDIDETVDPIGAIQQLRARNARLNAERQQDAAYQQLSTAYMEDARGYAAQTPDFGPAYKHLVNSRGNELKALGYNVQQINAQIRREEMDIAYSAFQNRQSPAAVIYEMAKARGYAKAAPAAATPPAKTVQEIADEATAKAAAAFSISPGGKAPSAGAAEASDIANLNGDDFDKGWAKLEKSSKKSSGMFRH